MSVFGVRSPRSRISLQEIELDAGCSGRVSLQLLVQLVGPLLHGLFDLREEAWKYLDRACVEYDPARKCRRQVG